MLAARQPIAILCLVLVLVAALVPAASGLLVAVLVSLWLLGVEMAGGFARRTAWIGRAPSSPSLPVVSPRPPPAA